MKHTVMEKAVLEQKSREIGVPFSNLVAEFILESFMCLLTESAFKEFLWIKSTLMFGLEQCTQENTLILHTAYLLNENVIQKQEIKPGQKLFLKMQYVMLSEILKVDKFPEIQWRGRPVQKESCVEFEITGTFENITVQLRMIVTELKNTDMMPEQKEISLFTVQEQSISYLEYPQEKLLVEQFFLIIKYMESLPEMYPYDIVYDILTHKVISGRNICKWLKKKCIENEIFLGNDHFDAMLSEETESFMKKRWEKYLERDNRKKPNWQDVINKIGEFFPDIWQAICQDELFFGDWMPELERFLG